MESQPLENGNEADSATTEQPSQEKILRRIDSIILELEKVRKIGDNKRAETPQTHLVNQLFGSLGRGESTEYDLDLDWERFGK